MLIFTCVDYVYDLFIYKYIIYINNEYDLFQHMYGGMDQRSFMMMMNGRLPMPHMRANMMRPRYMWHWY